MTALYTRETVPTAPDCPQAQQCFQAAEPYDAGHRGVAADRTSEVHVYEDGYHLPSGIHARHGCEDAPGTIAVWLSQRAPGEPVYLSRQAVRELIQGLEAMIHE